MIRTPETEQEWLAYYQLRYEILRAPWGQALGSEKTNDEAAHQHFAYFNTANEILGVGRLDMLDNTKAQIRFMAVASNLQKTGVGRQLMHQMENIAKAAGIQIIDLHAREQAMDFYKKLGYQYIEKSHLLFGEIQHHLMSKQL
jgi:N-acetylglutamate synthase-like GNAT family acetyltransferase